MTTALQHDIEVLDLNLVDPHPRNPRRDLGDLTELTASIKEHGVRNAIHVVVSSDGDRYVVVAGHRRRQASLDAGLKTIRAVLREDLKTDADAVVEMLVENLQRRDLSPVEEATAYEQLRIAGVKAPAIAKRTGIKRATVDARLALMKLPEQARDAVHGAQLSLDDAAALLEFADDEKTVAKLLRSIGGSDFTWHLQTARRHREAAARTEKTRTDLTAAGISIVTRPSNWQSYLHYVRLDLPATGDGDDVDEARRTAHAGCPHHAAYIDDNGYPAYVCLDPDSHKPATAEAAAKAAARSSMTAEEIEAEETAAAEAEEASRAQAERDAEDCRTAADIRRAWIRDTVTGRRGVLSQASCMAIALAVAQRLIGDDWMEGNTDDVAAYLELTLPEEPENANWQEQRDHEQHVDDLVRAEMERRGGHASLLARLAAHHEDYLDRPHSWEPNLLAPPSLRRDWMTLLWELGYEATEWEAARVAAADAAALEQPADDADEDGE